LSLSDAICYYLHWYALRYPLPAYLPENDDGCVLQDRVMRIGGLGDDVADYLAHKSKGTT